MAGGCLYLPNDDNEEFKPPLTNKKVLSSKTAIGLFIAGGGIFAANYLIGIMGAGEITFYLLIGALAIAIGVVVLIRDAVRNYHDRHPVRPSDGTS